MGDPRHPASSSLRRAVEAEAEVVRLHKEHAEYLEALEAADEEVDKLKSEIARLRRKLDRAAGVADG
jgi:uncharacterized membrane protein